MVLISKYRLFLTDLLRSIKSTWDKTPCSFSQCGEDLIIKYVFESYLKIYKPTYLDVGAHHPTFLSNTYLFYKSGCKGVCIEPDPLLFNAIKRTRKRDVCLNIGVGFSNSTSADFYIMTPKTLNTFSRPEAERYASTGNHRIERIVQIPLVSINEIIREHFNNCPNFISLDVEGLDFEILQSFDFDNYRPEVFCIETLSYSEDNSEKKMHQIIDHMILNGYIVYADTYINTVFVDKTLWMNRH